MKGPDLVEKMKKQLVKNGYPDVDVKTIGYGGNAHAANEFYVIEGAGKVYGMAGAEKTLAAVLFNYAGKS